MSQNQAEELMMAESEAGSVNTASPGSVKADATRAKARRVQQRSTEVAALARRLLQLLRGATPAEATALAKAIRKQRGVGSGVGSSSLDDQELVRAAKALRASPKFVAHSLVPKLALGGNGGGESGVGSSRRDSASSIGGASVAGGAAPATRPSAKAPRGPRPHFLALSAKRRSPNAPTQPSGERSTSSLFSGLWYTCFPVSFNL